MTASPSHSYSVKLTRSQLRTIQHALDFYQRMQMGQVNEMISVLPWAENVDWAAIHALLDGFGAAISAHTISKVGRSAYLSVGNDALPADNSMAYDIHRTIERFLSWERAVELGLVASMSSPRDWHTMLGVNYDEPAHYSSEPLPTIKRD
jgi:hypothetical protein